MLVWLLMLLSIIAVWFMIPDALGEKKKKLIFLVLTFGIIVFVVGSRHIRAASSGDLVGYYRWYLRAMEYPLDVLLQTDSMEHGYLILNKILAFIVPWKQFIFYFQAAFCTGVMLRYIYRNASNVFLGVMVYISVGPWQFFLTGIRQSIACCICFIAFDLIKKRKIAWDITALALIALASAMHTTAWLFLLVFIIRYLKLGKEIIIFSLLIFALGMIFSDQLMAWGNETLDRDYTAGFYSGNVLAGLVPILVYVIALVLTYIVWLNNKDAVESYSMEIKLMIFGICLYSLRYNTTVFERMSFYFTPVVSVLLPNAIMGQKKKTERIILSAVCLAMCAALFSYRAFSQYGKYRFYWE